MKSAHFDFVVFGSGLGGSIMSMVLRRLGHSVLLLEKGKHPRFAIGESSTPFSNLLLEQIADDYSLPVLRHLSKWGSWQKHHPELPVGLKRGFTFYHHRVRETIDWSDRSRQLLVAASPNEELADTNWYRSDVDQFLADEAKKMGVLFVDQFCTVSIFQDEGWTIEGVRLDEKCRFTAGIALDATGSESVIAGALGIKKSVMPDFPGTIGIFAHFKNVSAILDSAGLNPAPPYPPEMAAVHHLFEGGWLWMLRFNNDITSAGIAITESLAQRLQLHSVENEASFQRVLAQYPSINALFARAIAVTPYYQIDPLSFLREELAGENWALLPSACGFIDPLLSTGFALNLLGIRRIGRIFQETRNRREALRAYECTVARELITTSRLVSALYSKMGIAAEFNALVLIYFAALSYTESAHRLGKQHLAREFLLSDNDEFRKNLETICLAAQKGKPITHECIVEAIRKWDIAGLSDSKRNNWHPVDFEELMRNVEKLQSSAGEVLQMLQRCGLEAELLKRG